MLYCCLWKKSKVILNTLYIRILIFFNLIISNKNMFEYKDSDIKNKRSGV